MTSHGLDPGTATERSNPKRIDKALFKPTSSSPQYYLRRRGGRKNISLLLWQSQMIEPVTKKRLSSLMESWVQRSPGFFCRLSVIRHRANRGGRPVIGFTRKLKASVASTLDTRLTISCSTKKPDSSRRLTNLFVRRAAEHGRSKLCPSPSKVFDRTSRGI